MNKAQNSQWIDAWERDDEYSCAPLSFEQIEFIDSLISLAKNQHSSESTSIENVREDNQKSSVEIEVRFFKIDL